MGAGALPCEGVSHAYGKFRKSAPGPEKIGPGPVFPGPWPVFFRAMARKKLVLGGAGDQKKLAPGPVRDQFFPGQGPEKTSPGTNGPGPVFPGHGPVFPGHGPDFPGRGPEKTGPQCQKN